MYRATNFLRLSALLLSLLLFYGFRACRRADYDYLLRFLGGSSVDQDDARQNQHEGGNHGPCHGFRKQKGTPKDAIDGYHAKRRVLEATEAPIELIM